MPAIKIRKALLSVSDKQDLVKLARGLAESGIDLMSTGGTWRELKQAGINAREVSDYTGYPEMMDGRVKTLHPKIHGGLLGRRSKDGAVMAEHGIDPIDLLVVNLYPFEATVARPECTVEEAIENIDIGGPAMLRSAAKNMAEVAVVVDVADYEAVLDELRENDGALSDETRFILARKAFAHVARYDVAIADYLATLALPT